MFYGFESEGVGHADEVCAGFVASFCVFVGAFESEFHFEPVVEGELLLVVVVGFEVDFAAYGVVVFSAFVPVFGDVVLHELQGEAASEVPEVGLSHEESEGVGVDEFFLLGPGERGLWGLGGRGGCGGLGGGEWLGEVVLEELG